MTREYPESSSECYADQPDLDPDTDQLLLDADAAANFIASLIQNFTGEEVDGDGDPWGIACDHLHGLLHNLHEALTDAERVGTIALHHINNEYGYSIGRVA